MADFYKYPVKRPRTIDILEIQDCIEIILQDLFRYGVPDKLAMDFVSKYFIPLKRQADILKMEYGERCFSKTPDSAFKKWE
ncbi:MAG: hypothetical protein E7394_07155 [Ruminococcaceae bacterium]|nr:hypothetical protein [Oscillospiraceae bacterium]